MQNSEIHWLRYTTEDPLFWDKMAVGFNDTAVREALRPKQALFGESLRFAYKEVAEVAREVLTHYTQAELDDLIMMGNGFIGDLTTFFLVEKAVYGKDRARAQRSFAETTDYPEHVRDHREEFADRWTVCVRNMFDLFLPSGGESKARHLAFSNVSQQKP